MIQNAILDSDDYFSDNTKIGIDTWSDLKDKAMQNNFDMQIWFVSTLTHLLISLFYSCVSRTIRKAL